jgi:putative FmdB family regulatory protein
MKAEEGFMPRYEFLCEKCKKPFELIITISEREKGKPTCPKCKGTKVAPQFGGFMAQTSKKSCARGRVRGVASMSRGGGGGRRARSVL